MIKQQDTINIKVWWKEIYQALHSNSLDPDTKELYKVQVQRAIVALGLSETLRKAQQYASYEAVYELGQKLKFPNLTDEQNRTIGLWAARGFQL